MHDIQTAAWFAHVRIPLPTPKSYMQNSLLQSVLSTLSELKDEHSLPFVCTSEGQEMPLSHHVP